MFKRSELLMYLCVALSLLTHSGCVTVSKYSKKPVDILVVDAETNQPIENAQVKISYYRGSLLIGPRPLSINKPNDQTCMTDSSGECTIPIANFNGPSWTVAADGFNKRSVGSLFSRHQRIPLELIPPNENASYDAVIRLYRNPTPTYEISVPNGYQGPLLIKETLFDENLDAIEDGKRHFVYRPNKNGYVEVQVIPLVNHVGGLIDIDFRFEDGSKIPSKKEGVSDEAVVLRYVGSDIYVLGTKADYNAMHRKVFHYIGGDFTHTSENTEAIDLMFENAKEPTNN